MEDEGDTRVLSLPVCLMSYSGSLGHIRCIRETPKHSCLITLGPGGRGIAEKTFKMLPHFWTRSLPKAGPKAEIWGCFLPYTAAEVWAQLSAP